MSCYDDDNLDFSKIGKELNSAVEADEKYNRENDAKFRAVHQKVASYDEFRDIVLASHIKPLEKGDRISECKMNQPWNSVALNTDKRETSTTTNSTIEEGKRLPKSGLEFAQQWRRFYKTEDEQYPYLMDIGSEHLAKIFHTEISFGLLGEILKALCLFKKEDATKVIGILETLSKVNRFSLSMQFLSSVERDTCVKLFKNLQSCVSEDSDQLTVLVHLQILYGVQN
ncbi:hypothetical protein LOTGIDRAFT_180956 [Lottia gigantea]|uniref:Coiled-coil domain-containing protein 103 n=1 Tax=Lottia gigantea TaxID=225164 RepID=V4BGY5_LOTGI|nr:hypothetical protein LOTGIDRAFT_180956 [Lottia gigantea]ESP05187.1 hypothetical protein LOTGIDRAFT_180956 [Lottia gigantea]